MILLKRIRTEAVIPEKFRSNGKKAADKELLLAQRAFLKGEIEKIDFKSPFWKTAKAQLKRESWGKCAYCEANAEVVAHGDVEHYRPKSIYWWLAYTYDNYLFACQICNQIFKSDNFPIAALIFKAPNVQPSTTDTALDLLSGNISPDPIDVNSNYTLQEYLAKHKAEKPLLINPYFDTPSVFFAYEANDTTEEVTIVATKPKYQPYIKAMEDFYGLNRIELKNFRYQTFSVFRIFKKSVAELPNGATKNQVLKQIEKMKSDKYLFAGMNRYFDDKF
jgi:hypothetical protein